MSASRERKKRMVESEQAAPQQAKKTKKKLSEGWIFAIIVILIPVIVFGVIFGVQASWRNATVVSVGDHKVSTTEFNYFYRGALNSIYSTYGSYISLLGIDTSTPLDEQSMTPGPISWRTAPRPLLWMPTPSMTRPSRQASP